MFYSSLFPVLFFIAVNAVAMKLEVVKRDYEGNGVLCLLEGKKRIIFLAGTPQQMGRAHGFLLGPEIKLVLSIVNGVGNKSRKMKNGKFEPIISSIEKQSMPFVPKRFMDECDAMSAAAGITEIQGRKINFFPELFHCSGIAIRNKAALNGQVVHARVLDYMCGAGLQNYAAIMVFMPEKRNAWISQSYAGVIGTVTAMNDKGLAMGEMGGPGRGNSAGLPMTFLMRRIMEECSSVDEAIALMKKNPLTCNYYYVLSDKKGNLAAVEALSKATVPVRVFKPGQQCDKLPYVPEDTVFVSGRPRAEEISRRLRQYYGKIDAKVMIEIIKRPVAMKSNLHNAVFLPQSLTMYFADAENNTIACNETYYKINLTELINFYHQKMKNPAPAE